MMMTIDLDPKTLLPCPFCAKTESLVVLYDGTEVSHRVSCNYCECDGPVSYDNEEEAIRLWNTRVIFSLASPSSDTTLPLTHSEEAAIANALQSATDPIDKTLRDKEPDRNPIEEQLKQEYAIHRDGFKRIGTCSLCGGDVVGHRGVWLQNTPPPIDRCLDCLAVKQEDMVRVLNGTAYVYNKDWFEAKRSATKRSATRK